MTIIARNAYDGCDNTEVAIIAVSVVGKWAWVGCAPASPNLARAGRETHEKKIGPETR